MSLVNGRSPQAKRCGRDGAKRKSVRKRLPLRGSRCVEILRGSPSGIIEKQLPAGRAHSTIGKQLPPWKAHGTSGSRSSAQSKAPSGRATFRTSTIGTSNVPNQQHRDAQPAEPTPSGSSYRQGRRKARHLRGVTAGRETARLHREAAPQRKARHLREEQPAEPAASGRALFGK